MLFVLNVNTSYIFMNYNCFIVNIFIQISLKANVSLDDLFVSLALFLQTVHFLICLILINYNLLLLHKHEHTFLYFVLIYWYFFSLILLFFITIFYFHKTLCVVLKTVNSLNFHNRVNIFFKVNLSRNLIIYVTQILILITFIKQHINTLRIII